MHEKPHARLKRDPDGPNDKPFGGMKTRLEVGRGGDIHRDKLGNYRLRVWVSSRKFIFPKAYRGWTP